MGHAITSCVVVFHRCISAQSPGVSGLTGTAQSGGREGIVIDHITRADGGNTTAAKRLLGAIDWLATQKPGIYDRLEVPLHPALPADMEAQRWVD